MVLYKLNKSYKHFSKGQIVELIELSGNMAAKVKGFSKVANKSIFTWIHLNEKTIPDRIKEELK